MKTKNKNTQNKHNFFLLFKIIFLKWYHFHCPFSDEIGLEKKKNMLMERWLMFPHLAVADGKTATAKALIIAN